MLFNLQFQITPLSSVEMEYIDIFFTCRFLEPKEITASPNPSLITCSLTKPARERTSARRVRPQGTDRPQSHQVYKTKFGSMDSDLIDCLARRIQWKSTSSAAAQEACLKFPRVRPSAAI